MRVNQNGDRIEEEHLFAHIGQIPYGDVSDQDRDDAIALLCDHLGVDIIRTNATKHSRAELVLRKRDAQL